MRAIERFESPGVARLAPLGQLDVWMSLHGRQRLGREPARWGCLGFLRGVEETVLQHLDHFLEDIAT